LLAAAPSLLFKHRKAVRIIADPGHGGDDRARSKIDDPYRAAWGSIWIEPRAARHDGVLPVRRDCRALRIAWEDSAVGFGRTNDWDARNLRFGIMRQRSLDVDDRYVVRPIVGHDDLSPIGRPGKREWSGLAIGIVGSDLHPGHLGVGRAHPGEIHSEATRRWREKHRAAGGLPPPPRGRLSEDEMDLARAALCAAYPEHEFADRASLERAAAEYWNSAKHSGSSARIRAKWADQRAFGDPAPGRPRGDDGRLE